MVKSKSSADQLRQDGPGTKNESKETSRKRLCSKTTIAWAWGTRRSHWARGKDLCAFGTAELKLSCLSVILRPLHSQAIPEIERTKEMTQNVEQRAVGECVDDGWFNQPHPAESIGLWGWVRLHTCCTLNNSMCNRLNPPSPQTHSGRSPALRHGDPLSCTSVCNLTIHLCSYTTTTLRPWRSGGAQLESPGWSAASSRRIMIVGATGVLDC